MLATSDKDRLLFIPGPTPVSREILDALAEPTISHTSAELGAILTQSLSLLRRLMDNESGNVFVFAGSGTLAQEAAVVNFVEPGQTLLVASNGYFGDRITEIARAHGLQVITIQAPWGCSVQPSQIEEVLTSREVSVVALTHVETSTGAMTPLKQCLNVIKRAGAMSVVDAVAAFGGIPEPMTELGIDVLLAGSQKALGIPPGLAILGVGEQAWSYRERRATPVNAYYVDLKRWQPVMEDPTRYFATHPVNLIYALSKALEIIFEEGLPSRFERHEILARRFRDGMLALGFEQFTDSRHLAPTLSVLRTPSQLPSTTFRSRLSGLGVVAAGGLQDPDDRVVRFGHMGNISGAEIAVALDAAAHALNPA